MLVKLSFELLVASGLHCIALVPSPSHQALALALAPPPKKKNREKENPHQIMLEDPRDCLCVNLSGRRHGLHRLDRPNLGKVLLRACNLARDGMLVGFLPVDADGCWMNPMLARPDVWLLVFLLGQSRSLILNQACPPST